MYARDPPEDFDWVRYYDKPRIRTGPYAGRGWGVDSTHGNGNSASTVVLVAVWTGFDPSWISL